MYCHNCGTQNPDNASFCTSCGTSLRQNQENTQQKYEQWQSQYQQNPYGQGTYQQPNAAPPMQYKVNIKKRSIALAIVLSILTCGIYSIVWMICAANDLNTASGRTDDTSGGMVFLLALLTCGIYTIYWMYKAGEKVNEIRKRNFEAPDGSLSILYLLLSIFGFGIIVYCLIQSELNKVAALD